MRSNLCRNWLLLFHAGKALLDILAIYVGISQSRHLIEVVGIQFSGLLSMMHLLLISPSCLSGLLLYFLQLP